VYLVVAKKRTLKLSGQGDDLLCKKRGDTCLKEKKGGEFKTALFTYEGVKKGGVTKGKGADRTKKRSNSSLKKKERGSEGKRSVRRMPRRHVPTCSKGQKN